MAVLLVAVPAAFAPWLAFAFEPVKSAILVVGAALLAGHLLVNQPVAAPPGARPMVVLAGALGASFVVAALSWAPGRALVGSVERSAGALAWGAYLVCFAAVVLRCRRPAMGRGLVAAAVAGGVLPAAYGLGQALGKDPWSWSGDAVSVVGSTLGRSNFLGDYMAMLLPLVAARLWTAPRRRGGLDAVLAVVFGVVLAATKSRAAWIGAAVGLAITMTLLAGRRRRATALAAGGVAMVALAVGTLTLAAGPEAGAWNPASTGARITVWRWTGPLILRRPVLGYGPDTAGLLYPTLWAGARVDRAHNLILDLLLEVGVVGAGLYVALAAHALWRGTRRLVEEPAVVAGSMGGLAAFWAATMFSFGVITTWLLHWVLLGIVASRSDTSPPARRGGMAARTLAAGLVVGALGFSITALLAAAAARRSAVLRGAGADGVGSAARAVALAPYRGEYRIDLARALVVRGAGGREADAVAAAATAAEAARRPPPDAYRWLAAAEVQRAAAAQLGAPRIFDEAEASFRQAQALDEGLVEARSGLGLLFFLEGDLVAAEEELAAALALDQGHASSWERLGRVRLAAGDPNGAAEAYARAVANDPGLLTAQLGHGRALCLAGKKEEGRQKLASAMGRATSAGEIQGVGADAAGISGLRVAAATACQ